MWLAAWKLVSNDAKRTVALPNAKHSTLLQGCFLCFCFFYSIHDSATMHTLSPEIFHRTEIMPKGGSEIKRECITLRCNLVFF